MSAMNSGSGRVMGRLCQLARWGATALGTSDQLSEPGVEAGSWWWVDLSVRSPEYRFAVGTVFDGPAVFVQEPVVIATEQDQIGQVVETAICPVSPVMSMHPLTLPQPGNWQPPSRCHS